MKNTEHIPIMGIIAIDGFQLKYIVEGTGITTLVIGSALYYSRVFSQQLRAHLQIAFIDHRGFAQYTGPKLDRSNRTQFELSTILDDIETMRKKLQLSKVIIVGHSGHGYMALEYAKKYPESVSRVVLIGMGPDQSVKSQATARQYLDDSVCAERKAYLAHTMQELAVELDANPEKRFITYCLKLGPISWYNYAFDASALWKDITVNMPLFDYLWGEVFRDIDITKGLDTFDKPVLICLGKFDYLVAPFYLWDSIRPLFKNLTVRLFEASSHTPMYEESALFDKEFLTWLDQHK